VTLCYSAAIALRSSPVRATARTPVHKPQPARIPTSRLLRCECCPIVHMTVHADRCYQPAAVSARQLARTAALAERHSPTRRMLGSACIATVLIGEESCCPTRSTTHLTHTSACSNDDGMQPVVQSARMVVLRGSAHPQHSSLQQSTARPDVDGQKVQLDPLPCHEGLACMESSRTM
jgi:hypothetical protein